MKMSIGLRAVWVAAAIFGVAMGSSAFAKPKPKPSGPDLTDFVGAYTGKITFPTTAFGMPANFKGLGTLIITASGGKATFQFLCAANAGSPVFITTYLNTVSKITSAGKFTTTGQLNGSSFAAKRGRAKLRGKKLTSPPYLLTIPGSPTTLTWGVTFKLSGNKITATGPATFHDTFSDSTGTFTFKGKKIGL
jgi:hypothetical protein